MKINSSLLLVWNEECILVELGEGGEYHYKVMYKFYKGLMKIL